MKHRILSITFVCSLFISLGGSVGMAAADDWTQARIGSACPDFMSQVAQAVLGSRTSQLPATGDTDDTSPPNATVPSDDPVDPQPTKPTPVPIYDPVPMPTPAPTPAPSPSPDPPCGSCEIPPGATKYDHYACIMRMCPLQAD